MTRFARGGPANKKKPNEASSWQELKKASSSSSAHKHPPSISSGSGKSRTTSERAKTGSGSGSGVTHQKDVHKSKSKFKKKTSKKFNKLAEGFSNSELGNRGNQNSKSLIEELEEMDRQQMIAIHKEEVNEKRKSESPGEMPNDETNSQTQMVDKKTKRSEERRLKRQKSKQNKMVCFHCREAGHGIADCPRALMDAEQGTGVCYRCGSTEHDSSQCTARIDPNEDGEFPFAKCFICQEMGHLSRSCPDNPKGLYPMGGCCQFCESVEHMSWNCPHNKKLKGTKDISVATYSTASHQSADAEIFPAPKPVATVKKKPKIVKF